MLTDEEITDFVDAQKAKNTVSKTKSDVGIFTRWLADSLSSETRNLEEIPPLQLNSFLKSFYLRVRRKNGEEYEPETLISIKNSIDRYLCEKSYGFSVCRGEEFKSSRDVLSAKGKHLKKNGKGRKPNKAEEVTAEEEKKLWDLGIMGSHNPTALTRAVWWRNNFFGFRGRDEHRKLRWGDITIREEVDGTRYMMFEERDTKTRKNPSDMRTINPRLYETKDKPETCPVHLLLEYTHRRPVAMCQPDAPFYLQTHQSWNKSDQPLQTWYKCQPLGEHSLGNIMKEMACQANLPGRKTNHSGRKTTVKRLKDANFENTDIIQVTGHKSVQSLNSYCYVPNKIMKRMSKTLTACQGEASENEENVEFSSNDIEQIPMFTEVIDQPKEKGTELQQQIPLATNNSQSNKAFGLGTAMLSGAQISGGSFVFNINFNSQ